MESKPEALKAQLRALDSRLRDLLIERVNLSVNLSEMEGSMNMPGGGEDFDAASIRHVLQTDCAPLPDISKIRIWRELISAVKVANAGHKIAVVQDDSVTGYWDMARFYFGSASSMIKSTSALTAIGALREGDAAYAVIPWPQDGEQAPWWSFLFNQDAANKMYISAALPFGFEEAEFQNVHSRAVVISRDAYKPSGHDNSFIGIEVDAGVSRSRLVDALAFGGLKTLGLASISQIHGGQSSIHLFEVNDHVDESDPRLHKLSTMFDGASVLCRVLGGYAVPPRVKSAYRASGGTTGPVLQSMPLTMDEAATREILRKGAGGIN